ncbi:hypothetical protein D9M72_229130 [compost metagenome]
MRMREAEQHPLRIRVVVRRALARQVRQEQRAARPVRQRDRRRGFEQRRLVRELEGLRRPAHRAGGREHHRHLVPAPGQRVAEGVHRLRGVRQEAVGRDEHHARGAERDEALPRLHEPHADRAGGVVARAAGDLHALAQPPARRQVRLEQRGDFTAFHEPRHVSTCEPRGGQQFVGPVARAHVEPQRAGRVGHLADRLAAEHEAQPVLRQQHARHAGEDLGLVLAHPQQLGRGEAGHREVAGDLAQARHGARERLALRAAAAVVPEDGRAQHLAFRVEQRGAVHLARQADGAYLRQRLGVRGAQLGHDRLERLPPLGGRLLGPQRVRPVDRERRACHADDAVIVREQQCLELGRAEVESQIQDGLPDGAFGAGAFALKEVSRSACRPGA